MKDGLDRTIDYLRISVTDRCNLRCHYCMPESGVEFMPHEKILTYEEILRICRLYADIGLRRIKLTGGEPLVRKEIWWLVKELKSIEGIEKVTMTTNGILLKDSIEKLAEAGLDAVNISLDTLDPGQFKRLTRHTGLESVLEGIEAALMYSPDISVKINCVPLRSSEAADQIIPLVGMAKDRNLHVRFIELMPIGLGREMCGWSEEEIRAEVESAYGSLMPYRQSLGNGPSVYYSLEGFCGKVGFISAISHKFCDSCNRVRITSDGFLKACLQYEDGVDLKSAMTAGISDEGLLELIQIGIYRKPKAHKFSESQTAWDMEQHIMSRIGG